MPFLVDFLGMVVVPCLLMGAVFFFLIRRAYRSQLPARSLLLYPLICSFIVTSVFMVGGYYDTCTSRASTAAIGFLVLPFLSVAVAVAAVVISWSCLYVVHFVLDRSRGIPVRATSVVLFALAIVLLAWAGYVAQEKFARHRLLSRAASGADVDSLEKILADAAASQDIEVLAALAKNGNTPKDDLVRIFDFCKPNVATASPPEYPVLFSLARNPETPPDILAVLARCRQATIRLTVATNPSTSVAALHQLAGDQDDLVRGYALSRLPKARDRK